MTTQIAVRLPAELVAEIDRLIQSGAFGNRSEAVRAGLVLLAERRRSRALDDAFAKGFGRLPEQPEELAEAHRLAVEAINKEPWEKWW